MQKQEKSSKQQAKSEHPRTTERLSSFLQKMARVHEIWSVRTKKRLQNAHFEGLV
jgi:hypothetical protein